MDEPRADDRPCAHPSAFLSTSRDSRREASAVCAPNRAGGHNSRGGDGFGSPGTRNAGHADGSAGGSDCPTCAGSRQVVFLHAVPCVLASQRGLYDAALCADFCPTVDCPSCHPSRSCAGACG